MNDFSKDYALAIQTLKVAILTKQDKVRKLITDWLIKWADYLQRESTTCPYRQLKYSAGEILLVDFGFRIGNEIGGRHYAVVMEKNSNPKSGVLFLAPISSYNPALNEKPRVCNVDLGINAIGNSGKGAEIVIDQTGAYSKIRIECSMKKKIPKDKFNSIVECLYKKISIKQ